jgi:pantetheine-phosphate adenylyltransferase
MKKIGIYPGSFNPFHEGHKDIVDKALQVFDEVQVVIMENPDKVVGHIGNVLATRLALVIKRVGHIPRVSVHANAGTLIDLITDSRAEKRADYSIIRGLRNGNDLQYEMNNQYWNEDLGIDVPFVYFITDRKLAHVSSSAIRSVRSLGLAQPY